ACAGPGARAPAGAGAAPVPPPAPPREGGGGGGGAPPRRETGARRDGGDEGDAAGAGGADEHDRLHARLLTHGESKVAQLARGEAVDARHDDAVIGGGGPLARPARGPLGPPRPPFVAPRLVLLEALLPFLGHGVRGRA